MTGGLLSSCACGSFIRFKEIKPEFLRRLLQASSPAHSSNDGHHHRTKLVMQNGRVQMRKPNPHVKPGDGKGNHHARHQTGGKAFLFSVQMIHQAAKNASESA